MKLSSSDAALAGAPHNPPAAERPRLQFVVALRALASVIIVWHHFALYPPLREWAAPLIGGVLDWLELHARATQVFFVVGGYVMARSMAARTWDLRRFAGFVRQRYCRLGIPYLGAIALVIPASLLARGWLPDEVLGADISLPQMLAHVIFLQDILGYEHLSAGLWFVCINFQLGLVYAALLWFRDTVGRGRIDFVGWIGWPLALVSLFHFNLDDAWASWWFYFFPYFFMGTVIHRNLAARKAGNGKRTLGIEFWLYQGVFVAAMLFEWRWRLLSAFVIGCVLYSAERQGWGARWPRNRAVLWLGNISFSLFLVHFPVLVFVATLWTRLQWTSPPLAVAGLLTAFAASVVVAAAFNRWIERPAARLGRSARPTSAERALALQGS